MPATKGNGGRKKDAAAYDAPKTHRGRRYTGMKVGGRHTWDYDAGEWKEVKKTPDRWDFKYEVPKRRRGKAPPGSGAPVDTEYHWFIVADQYVKKLDANTYSTCMEGHKFKVAHKRAAAEEWSPKTERAKQKRLLDFLEQAAAEVRAEMEATAPRRKAKKAAPKAEHRLGELPGEGTAEA